MVATLHFFTHGCMCKNIEMTSGCDQSMRPVGVDSGWWIDLLSHNEILLLACFLFSLPKYVLIFFIL